MSLWDEGKEKRKERRSVRLCVLSFEDLSDVHPELF
jgi:hypothetical protein